MDSTPSLAASERPEGEVRAGRRRFNSPEVYLFLRRVEIRLRSIIEFADTRRYQDNCSGPSSGS